MKNDLITSVGAAIFGTLIAFFVCNMFLPKIEDFSFKVLDSKINYTLVDPDPEVFNYRSVNPTVEVIVGSCTDGDCNTSVIIEETETDEELFEEETIEDQTESSENTESNQGTANGTTD